jgi:hypothetical protein
MRKWAFTKAPQVLAFSNVKGKDLTLILLLILLILLP